MSRSWVARVLRIVTPIRDEEGPSALMLLASVFLILTAYYMIKPAREGWLSVSAIAGLSKIEIKAYASFGQVVVLIVVVRLYSSLVSTWPRAQLVTRVNLFLGSNLIVFWALQPGFFVEEVPFLGVAFYLWVGIFNVFIVAQFWAYAADFYTHRRGRRLLPLVALGANCGAVFGAWFSQALVDDLGLEALHLMLVAALPLLISTLLLERVERRGPIGQGLEARSESQLASQSPAPASPDFEVPATSRGALSLIRRHPLLSSTALLTLVYGWVGANGENVLFSVVQTAIASDAAGQGISDAHALQAFTLASTTSFYGNFYFWVNLCGLLLQALVASRMLRMGGFGAIFLCLPLISAMGYLAMSLVPALGVIKLAKILENSTNYSIHNTARGVLWLPTTTEMKFKAKQTIDTLFVRLGDGFAALTVLVGINVLAFSPLRIFWLNIVLSLIWIALAVRVVREHRFMVERNR